MRTSEQKWMWANEWLNGDGEKYNTDKNQFDSLSVWVCACLAVIKRRKNSIFHCRKWEWIIMKRLNTTVMQAKQHDRTIYWTEKKKKKKTHRIQCAQTHTFAHVRIHFHKSRHRNECQENKNRTLQWTKTEPLSYINKRMAPNRRRQRQPDFLRFIPYEYTLKI